MRIPLTFALPPERAPRGLLVDYGGVLTGSIFEAFHAFERREGLEHGVAARRFRSDPQARDLLIRLETGVTTVAEFESGMGAVLGVSAEGLSNRLLDVQPDQTMIGAVRAIHSSGIRTGLLSNSWGLSGYPLKLLRELFDAVILSGEVGLRKPDPEIYRLAAGQIGVEPGDCVFVDDLPGNLAPAVALGMTGLHHTDPRLTMAELGRLFRLDLGPDAPAGADPDSEVQAQTR